MQPSEYLSNANLTKVKLRKANFKGANLEGANLQYNYSDWKTILAKRKDANFDSAKLTGTIMPDGTTHE
jgi:uncharacterized protein YjbI with pentapeptide repeats